LQQLNAAFQPRLNVAGGQAAQLLHGRFGAAAQGLTLAIVVEEDETGERNGHHKGSSQQNLVAEFHVSGHRMNYREGAGQERAAICHIRQRCAALIFDRAAPKIRRLQGKSTKCSTASQSF
jgi:hypothetical protein